MSHGPDLGTRRQLQQPVGWPADHRPIPEYPDRPLEQRRVLGHQLDQPFLGLVAGERELPAGPVAAPLVKSPRSSFSSSGSRL